MTQRTHQPKSGFVPRTSEKGSESKGRSGQLLSSQLRGMSFEEGERLLSPKDDGEGAMLSPKGGQMLPAPGLKSRLGNSTYKRVYDLDKKAAKASGKKRETLISQLIKRAETYLANHKEGRSTKQDERIKGVRALLGRLTGKASTTPPTKVEETRPMVTTSTKPKPSLKPPPLLSEKVVDEKVVDEKVVETKTETPIDQEPPEETTLPTEVTDENVSQVLGQLDLPVVDLTTQQEDKGGDKKVEVDKVEKGGGESKVSEEEKPRIPEAPPLPQAKAPASPNFGTLPNGITVEQLGDASVQLTPAEIAKLDYRQLVHYFDTRDKGHVESLRNEAAVVDRIMSFGAEQMANLVVRVILRTPGSVVDRGGARAEAIRVLSSQLRAKYIAKKLLTGDVLVVIVPKNMLMTDLPEFRAQQGTYTFDGRPWDTVRGLGGRNTAITEENLLGQEVSTDPGVTRKGWENQTQYDQDRNAGTTTNRTRDFKPDVYCSGYSTTNHEFFHTIHKFGLSKADASQIESLYKAKKSQPAATEWADGPRLNQNNNVAENYASSTVYEYFAQTGCAYQGTNKGVDPQTGRPRNNGRGWVEQNEPGLASIFARTCQDEELKGVNPRDQVKALEHIKNGGVAKAGEMKATQNMNPKNFANRARLEKLLNPVRDQPPGVLVETK